MKAQHSHQQFMQRQKKRELLLRELELGVWTPAEYRTKVAALESPIKPAQEVSGRLQRNRREPSPDWADPLPDHDEESEKNSEESDDSDGDLGEHEQ